MDQAPQEKVWFLYLMIEDHINEFCEKSSSAEKPVFELLYDDKCIPAGKVILQGSKMYIIECVDGHYRDRDPKGETHCFDLKDPKGPSLRPCKEDSTPPQFIDQVLPGLSITIEDKIYVVEEPKKKKSSRRRKKKEPPSSSSSLSPFRVYDRLHKSWKALPDPQVSFDGREWMSFAVGHKLVVSEGFRLESYMFDTRREIWEDCPKISDAYDEREGEDILNYGIDAFVEFEGFLIGVPRFRRTIAAYRWDSNGFPSCIRCYTMS